MTLVRNNKPARIGLPTESGATIYFQPGTHDYPDKDLEGIPTQRAAVRAYLEPQEGKPAILEIMEPGQGTPDPTPDEKKPAAEIKKMIAKSTDPDWLRSVIAGDDRTTVIAAADIRLVEVLAQAQDNLPSTSEPPTLGEAGS